MRLHSKMVSPVLSRSLNALNRVVWSIHPRAFHQRWSAALLFIVFMATTLGCGSDEAPEALQFYAEPIDGMSATTPTQPGGQTSGQGTSILTIQDALALPHFGAQLGQELIQGGAYAVLIATQATGGVNPVTTGTVTLNGQNPSYETVPSDALILVVDGFRYRYRVDAFQYTQGIESVGEYFEAPHQFVATVSLESEDLSVTIGSSNNDRRLEVYMRGEVGTQANGLLQMQLTLTDQLASDIDGYSGLEYEHGTTLAGEIRNADGRIVIQVLDTALYHAVAFDRIAENRHHFIEHEVSLDGVQYSIQDVRIRSAFIDGCPTDFEYWIGEGVLLRNGTAAGRISLTRQSGAMVVGLTINNEDHILETHPLCD